MQTSATKVQREAESGCKKKDVEKRAASLWPVTKHEWLQMHTSGLDQRYVSCPLDNEETAMLVLQPLV